jgi:hypothetical protein
VSLNVSRAYKTKLCKLSGIPLEQFDFYYRKAFQRLNCNPTDVALIAKTMRYMARQYDFMSPTKNRTLRPTNRKFSVDEISDIIKRYKNKELIKNIASIHRTSTSVISEVAKRSGLPGRNRGPQRYFSESET